MEAAPYLHRQFLLSIDIFQRDLAYHRRYVNYLMSKTTNPDRYIAPSIFLADLSQENNALSVLDNRLKAIRERTTTILEMVCVVRISHCEDRMLIRVGLKHHKHSTGTTV